MRHSEVTLDDKYLLEDGRAFITGVQALIRVMLDRRRLDLRDGLNTAGYVSGYRGSPLGGLDQQAARSRKLLTAHEVVFQEGLNEDLAATAVWGSQQANLFPGAKFDGVFGLWYGKAPGNRLACWLPQTAVAARSSLRPSWKTTSWAVSSLRDRAACWSRPPSGLPR